MSRKIASLITAAALVFGVVALFAHDAAAQGATPEVKYKKKTVYDFDDDVVEGELMRPDGEYIDTRRKAKHSSLIKIRLNFIPEMLKSAENI